MFGLGKILAAGTTALILGIVGTASAARDATPEEHAAMMEAATFYPDTEGLARVSTINGTWGFTATDSGLTVLRRGVSTWGEFTSYTAVMDRSGETWACSNLRADGIPVSVIDDLRLANVKYSCAKPPPLIPCKKNFRSYTFVKKPKKCQISWDLSAKYGGIEATATFSGMRWTKWTRDRAVATASVVVKVDYVDEPVRGRVRVEFWRPKEASVNGYAFTRFRIHGAGGSLQAYPIAWENQ